MTSKLEFELYKACEEYKRNRYLALSQDAKKMVEDVTMLDYFRLTWERDYYRERLIACEEELTGGDNDNDND